MVTHPMKQGTFTVSSGYGPRWGTFHAGLDFAAPIGTPIYAAADGLIIEGKDRTGVAGFGSWIWLDAQQSAGVDLIYGHVKHAGILVRKGDRVKAGQQIGVVGNEGETTGPHLHFEVWGPPGRVGGAHRDPAAWLRGATQPGAAAAAPSAPQVSGGQMKDWNTLEPAKYTLVGSHRFTRGRSRPIDRIVIHHNAANNWSAEQVRDLWNTSREASAHYQVESNGTIAQLVNDRDTAWHAANADINARSIGIEHANISGPPRWQISDATVEAGAHLVAALCRFYKLGPPRWGVNVFGHSQFAATSCPVQLNPGGEDHQTYMRRAAWWYDNPNAAPNQGGFLMALSDAEQRELLDKTREIHRELTQRYPSRSAYRATDEPIDTMAGMLLNVDARVHEDWVHARAKEAGMTPTEFAKKLGAK